MAFDAMMLGVYRIPEITVNSGTDWVTLFGFLLTSIAVIAGSIVTVWTFKGTVRSQENLAKSVSLKQSRQDWINELRNCCAEYVACVMALQSQRINLEGRSAYLNLLQVENPTAALQMAHDINADLKDLRLRAFTLKSKITLLSNPVEPDFQKLSEAVEECMVRAEVLNSNILEPCGLLTSVAQTILKKEWDRAKNMS